MNEQLLSAIRASQSIRSDHTKKTESERNIVARIMAKRELADQYLSEDFAHMQAQSWWAEPLFYHAFMFLLAMRVEDTPATWARDMKERGLIILKREETAI